MGAWLDNNSGKWNLGELTPLKLSFTEEPLLVHY